MIHKMLSLTHFVNDGQYLLLETSNITWQYVVSINMRKWATHA